MPMYTHLEAGGSRQGLRQLLGIFVHGEAPGHSPSAMMVALWSLFHRIPHKLHTCHFPTVTGACPSVSILASRRDNLGFGGSFSPFLALTRKSSDKANRRWRMSLARISTCSTKGCSSSTEWLAVMRAVFYCLAAQHAVPCTTKNGS